MDLDDTCCMELNYGRESKRILIVEDDLTVQPLLEKMIYKISPGTHVEWTTTAEDAFDRLSTAQKNKDEWSKKHSKTRRSFYSVVLSDINLAGKKSGLELAADCLSNNVEANFVLMSGTNSLDTRLPFLSKPYRFADVKRELSPFLVSESDILSSPSVEVGFARSLEIAKHWLFFFRERKFECFAVISSAYVCAWVMMQLIESLKHLPFRP